MPMAIYTHPLIFIHEDFTLRAVMRAFEQCDVLRYWRVLHDEPLEARDC